MAELLVPDELLVPEGMVVLVVDSDVPSSIRVVWSFRGVALLYGPGIGAKDLRQPQEGCNIILSSFPLQDLEFLYLSDAHREDEGDLGPDQNCRQCVAIPELRPAQVATLAAVLSTCSSFIPVTMVLRVLR